MAFTDKIGNVFNKAKSGTIAVSLEAKKKMKESSIKGEISSLESKKISVFTEVGNEAYEKFLDTLGTDAKLKELLDSIQDLKDQISGKEKELEEAMAQFDKEIAEVKEGGSHTEAAPDAADSKKEEPKEEPKKEETQSSGSGKVFCGQCGAQNSTDSKFCNSCGAKI